MCLDNQFGSCSLETYAPLDADNGIAYVGIAANGVRGTNLLNLLDGLDLVIEVLAVNTDYLTLLELDFQQSFLFLGCHVLQIGLLGQTLCGVEQLATADTGTPNTYVI